MYKNKKLISLICAIAMIFTMLSGLAISANAEGEKGFTITNVNLADDSKTVTFDVGYTGFEGGISSGKFIIDFAPNAVTSAKGEKTDILSNAPLVDENLPKISSSFTATSAATKSADTLMHVTVVFTNEITKDIKFDIANGSQIYTDLTTVYKVSDGGMQGASGTIHNDNAPTPKPTTDQARPTPVAVPTANPDATAAPTLAPAVTPATGEKGITVSEPTVTDGGKKFSFDVGYTGFEGGISSGKFIIVLPTDASNIKKVEGIKTDILSNAPLVDENLPTISSSFTATSAATKAEDTLMTINVELNEKLDSDQLIAIAKGSQIYTDLTTVYKVSDGTLVGSSVVLKAEASGEEPTPAPVLKEVALTDAISITPDEVNAKDTPEDGVSDYYIIPNVKVGDDDATYGDDYVATIKKTDGSTKELTKAEYQNLMSGNFSAVPDLCTDAGITKMGDVISKLGLKIYNKDAVVNPKLVYVTTDDAGNPINEIQNDGDEPITVGPAAPTPKPTAAPTMSIDVTSGGKTVKEVEIKSIVTVTVDVPAAIQVEGAALAKDLVIDKDGYLELISSDVDETTATYKYQATKTGTVNITANYVKEKAADVEIAAATTTTETVASAKASLKITAAKSTSSGGSGSGSSKDSTSSGGGAIASGLVDSGSSYIPSLGFDDLGDVEWAQTAINTLAARKIVSGVGDNKFDPNAALTRAAYAQMLVNAIGHSTDSADTEFNDVPTDAWFYHNVAVAAQLGIVSGYGDGNFGPYDLITREQMALMTQKAAEVTGRSLVGADAGTFTDDADIADWSRDAVYTLANAGIINGMGDGTFAPQANATRAQAAVIIYNTFVK